MSDLLNSPTLSNLMPDTEGVNFYSADPDLSFLLRRHLSDEDYERAQLILAHLGSVASWQGQGQGPSHGRARPRDAGGPAAVEGCVKLRRAT